MTRYKFFYEDAKEIRDTHQKNFEVAKRLHATELELVKILYDIDRIDCL